MDPMGQLKFAANDTQPDSVATEGREAQDHEFAGGIANGIGGPSPRPEADDGQWSQDPEKFADDECDIPTQPMQGWYQEEDVIRFGAAVRDMMRNPYPTRQAQQAGRGGR
jgi:hypothetical protein